MPDMTEIRARLDFRRAALKKLREAYLTLIDGGVKSYRIDDRELTRFDLPALKAEILDNERALDELEQLASRLKPRKMVGVTPRDW